MNRKSLNLYVVLVVVVVIPSFAQVDMSRYFNQGALPLISRSKPLKVQVEWTMDGKSQKLLNEGLNYLDEGKPSLALANIDSFVNKNYKMWEGHYYRGQSLMHLGKFKAAEVEFRMVTKLNPNLAEGYLELGEALELQNNLTQANEQFAKAAETKPKFVYAQYKMGNLALVTRQIPSAVSHYKKCNKIDPMFPDAYMALGIISYLKDKKSIEALPLFEKALQADSTFTQAYFWRGLALLEQNKKEECLKDWDLFISYNPRNQFVKTMHGFLNAELRKFDDAFSDFRKVLENTSVSEDKFLGGQTSLDKKIDLQSAANYLIAKGYGLKEEVFSKLKAGFCLMLMDRDREAMEALRAAERMSSTPAVYFLMAIAFEHGGAHQLAFEFYNKTLSYDNDVFDAHKKRSIYLSELKQWDAAYRDINEMLRLQPRTPVAYRLRGLMEANQHKCKEAIADLTLFMNSDSTDHDALLNRALCYSLSNQPKEANKDAARILQIDPRPEVQEGLIRNFIAVNDTTNAVFFLRSYYTNFFSLKALLDISNMLLAQKKYDEVTAEVTAGWEKLKAQEAKLPGNYRDTKSTLYQIQGAIAFKRSLCTEAIDFFSSSLKEDPNNSESKYLRGKCFAKTNNTKKALVDFKDLADRKYKDAKQLFDDLQSK